MPFRGFFLPRTLLTLFPWHLISLGTMNTLFTICFQLGALALMQGAAKPMEPTKGKVLLLENERVLEGDIELSGDRYRIKRSIGETQVPTDHVMRLCASMDDAYKFLKSRTNLEDPDERLKLVSWCVRYNLRERAVEEATAAVELRPEHAGSKRLLHHLKTSLEQEAMRKEFNPNVLAEEHAPVMPIEVANDSLSLFNTRVQPILMNTCASCHAAGKGGNFKIHRVYDISKSNQKTMQHNLAAVLGQVNLQQPDNSPFLGKALAVHGGASKPPLKGRDSETFRILEDWVRLTTARSAVAQNENASAVPSSFAEDRNRPSKPAKEPEAEKEKEKGNPFDPEVFNKLFNPMK